MLDQFLFLKSLSVFPSTTPTLPQLPNMPKSPSLPQVPNPPKFPNLNLPYNNAVNTVARNAVGIGQIAMAAVSSFLPRAETLYISDPKGTQFFFDGVMREDHTFIRKITEHPVQDGANITDHSYQMPDILILDVMMSEAMRSIKPLQFGDKPWSTKNWSLTAASQGSGGLSSLAYTTTRNTMNLFANVKTKTKVRPRSVSAYEELVKMQRSGLPVSVQTRLKLYENMLIESIKIQDDEKTVYSMVATITFKEVFVSKSAGVVEESKSQYKLPPVFEGASMPKTRDEGLMDYVHTVNEGRSSNLPLP